MLEINTTPAGDCLVVSLRGEITSASASQLEQSLNAALSGLVPPRCVLDLGGLVFTSSAGLRVFLGLAKRIKNAGGRLAFCAVKPAVREVFEVSGFTRILALVDDVAAARDLVQA
jgi:anti-anti-sigma factor